MKQSNSFSSNIQSIRLPAESEYLMCWRQTKIMLLKNTETNKNKL